MYKIGFKKNLLTIFATFWLLFTIALVTWWWVYVSSSLENLPEAPKIRRMFLWEGSFLLATIIAGGISLIVLSIKDQLRHQRLKIFFSHFSHDIKTSIARLRLQAEILQEDHRKSENADLIHLLTDISRLDLQLENSLYIANLEESQFLLESVTLSQILKTIRNEWPDIQIIVRNDIGFTADERALVSVFRNIFSNAQLHASASLIEINTKRLGEKIQIEITNDGKAFKGDLDKLGKKPLISETLSSNGLGFYLSSELIKKMSGDLFFKTTDSGQLIVILSLPAEPILNGAV